MAREKADLSSLLFAQDFLEEHWKWTDKEKEKLGDIEEMGKIIKARLEAGGCEIAEMYGIRHDKDERKIWNEYTVNYEIQFTRNHAHFVIKFCKGKGKTLEVIADLIGIEPNFIERPKRGRYAYDNMLSYLIHIKYEKKYQYPVSSVYTFAGKQYTQHYRERREAWLKGRAEKNLMDAKKLYNFLLDGIIKGTITKADLLKNDEWRYVYTIHLKKFDDLIESKKHVDLAFKEESLRTLLSNGIADGTITEKDLQENKEWREFYSNHKYEFRNLLYPKK